MKGVLIFIGLALLLFWAISLFFKLFGAAVHVLLVVALIFLAYSIMRPSARKDEPREPL